MNRLGINTRYLVLLAVGAFVPLLAGCGSGLNPVKGKVVYSDGAPVKGGSITFNNSETKTNASGSIAEDGSFSLSFGGKNGAPAGKYNVVVSGSGAYGEPETVAPIYGDPLKTPLRQTIADGPNDLTVTVERPAKK